MELAFVKVFTAQTDMMAADVHFTCGQVFFTVGLIARFTAFFLA
jgi:hypothetical protein